MPKKVETIGTSPSYSHLRGVANGRERNAGAEIGAAASRAAAPGGREKSIDLPIVGVFELENREDQHLA
jgi:hypothetical protein